MYDHYLCNQGHKTAILRTPGKQPMKIFQCASTAFIHNRFVMCEGAFRLVEK